MKLIDLKATCSSHGFHIRSVNPKHVLILHQSATDRTKVLALFSDAETQQLSNTFDELVALFPTFIRVSCVPVDGGENELTLVNSDYIVSLHASHFEPEHSWLTLPIAALKLAYPYEHALRLLNGGLH